MSTRLPVALPPIGYRQHRRRRWDETEPAHNASLRVTGEPTERRTGRVGTQVWVAVFRSLLGRPEGRP